VQLRWAGWGSFPPEKSVTLTAPHLCHKHGTEEELHRRVFRSVGQIALEDLILKE